MVTTLRQQRWTYVASLAGTAIAYIVFALIGFTLAHSVKEVTAVWAPAGIALAAILLGGYRLWPAIWIAAFIANLTNHVSPLTAAGIAVGNTLGPLVGAFLLRYTGFDVRLQRLRDVVIFVVLGAIVAMTVTSTNGVLNLALAHVIPWHNFGSTWTLWWGGDAMGTLIVTPFILTWATRSRDPAEGHAGELFMLFLVMLLVALLAFPGSASTMPSIFHHQSFIYPVVMWSAIRFRQRETTTVIALFTIVSVAAIAHQPGVGSIDQRLANTMTFLAILALTGMVISALTTERRKARRRLDATLRKTTRIAQTLQEAMLPKRLPHHRRLQFDALYATAEHDALVGGDWYDVFVLPDDSVLITVGDVSGHGIEAAVTAERIRQALFAGAVDSDDPALILTKADRALQLQSDTIATAIVAVIDPHTNQMWYASAGHPPPVIAAPSVPPQLLETGGLPLGIARAIHSGAREPKTHHVALPPEALVVFYTDGLIEFSRNAQAVEERLLHCAARLVFDHTARPAQALRSEIMGSASPHDDTVLLTVRLLPED